MSLLFPSAEQVAVTWIKSLNTTADGVATTLPQDPLTWADHGFIQVRSASGSGRIDAGTLRGTVMQVDCWATNPNSQKVPWGKASELASQLWYACDDELKQNIVLQIGSTPGTFYDAAIYTAYPLSDMRRFVSGGGLSGESTTKTTRDPSMGFAQIQFDLMLNWQVIR